MRRRAARGTLARSSGRSGLARPSAQSFPIAARSIKPRCLPQWPLFGAFFASQHDQAQKQDRQYRAYDANH
jgi:hypothetical protein